MAWCVFNFKLMEFELVTQTITSTYQVMIPATGQAVAYSQAITTGDVITAALLTFIALFLVYGRVVDKVRGQ